MIRKVCFLLLFLAAASASAQPDDLMRRGEEAYRAARYEEALRYFSDVARQSPDYPGVYEYRGNIYFILGDYLRAEADFTRAIEKSLRRGSSTSLGTYEYEGVKILDPNPNSANYAVLYNNRGASRLMQGRAQEALDDFSEALSFDPALETARSNRRQAETGYQTPRPGTGQPYTGTSTQPDYDSYRQPARPPYQQPDRRYVRPVEVPEPVDLRRQRTETASARADRLEITDLYGKPGSGPARGGDFVRRVPASGKEYVRPAVGASAMNYVSIEKVRITPVSTVITLRIANPEPKAHEVCISAPGSPDAFYLTDRNANPRNTYKLTKAQGIAFYPQTTQLAANAVLIVTLEFPKIADDMGFFHLLEGTRTSGNEWNFYDVDVAR
jgi:tetratricopeptide (TPR) repeat protein